MSTTAFKLADPTTVILCEVEVAVNLYHTSSLAFPVEPLHAIAANDWVAPATVPFVALEQVGPLTVKVVAPEQLLLAGAGIVGVVTHIVNVVVAGTVL